MQIEAGADAVQLFDSWVGALAPEDYAASCCRSPERARAARGVRRARHPLRDADRGRSSPTCGAPAAAVIGVDWRIELADAWDRLGPDVAVQGNLDPVALLAPWPVTAEAARAVLASVAGRAGHMFNLGHGILPETPVEAATDLVQLVHEESARLLAG